MSQGGYRGRQAETKAINEAWRREVGAAMRDVRESRGASQPGIGRHILLDSDGRFHYESPYIGRVERGQKPAPTELLIGYRDFLGASIEELPYAYLAEARRGLDEREVGLERAVENLRGLGGAAAALALPPSDPEAILRALEDRASTLEGDRGSGTAASQPPRRSSRRRAS